MSLIDEVTIHTRRLMVQAAKVLGKKEDEEVLRVALSELIKNRNAFFLEVAFRLVQLCSKNGIDPLEILIYIERRYGRMYAKASDLSEGEVTVTVNGETLRRLAALCGSASVSPSELFEGLILERWKSKMVYSAEPLNEPILVDDDLYRKLEEFAPADMTISSFAASILRSLLASRKVSKDSLALFSEEIWWKRKMPDGDKKDMQEFLRILLDADLEEEGIELDFLEWREKRREEEKVRVNVMLSKTVLERIEKIKQISGMNFSEHVEFALDSQLNKLEERVKRIHSSEGKEGGEDD